MSYSLYLGTGPVGQIELFSALCKKKFDSKISLDEAIDSSYNEVKKISLNFRNQTGENPFPGYGVRRNEFNQEFAKFHSFEVYEKYARLVVPHLVFPLIAVDGNKKSHNYFSNIVQENDLITEIVPMQMRLDVGDNNGHSTWNINEYLPEVKTLIDQKGFPSVIGGAHFMSIAAHITERDYGGIKFWHRIPWPSILSLMDDYTKIAFIEEGDFIFREGNQYRDVFLHKGFPESSLDEKKNLESFELLTGKLIKLLDEDNCERKFNVFPKRFVGKYHETGGEEEQQLIVFGEKIS
jgi:hypothetical protein